MLRVCSKITYAGQSQLKIFNWSQAFGLEILWSQPEVL